MDFDELQKNWRSQKVEVPGDNPAMHGQLITRLQKQQRRVMWANIGTTLGFIAVLILIVHLYCSFHNKRSIFFGGSLLFMFLLLCAYLGVIWKGIAYKKIDVSQPSNDYITHLLSKLYWRRKTITTYTWVYAVLLWLTFMFYCIDITRGGSLLLQIGAPAAITIYIFGVQFFVKRFKQKKQLTEINQLIADMTQLRDSMEE